MVDEGHHHHMIATEALVVGVAVEFQDAQNIAVSTNLYNPNYSSDSPVENWDDILNVCLSVF